MQIPFSTEQFLDVIKFYNEAFFPIQILFNILAFWCVYLLFTDSHIKRKTLLGYLSFLWLWMGIAYHLTFFTSINNAAYLFGALFILQGILLGYYAFAGREITFRFQKTWYNVAGILFLFYALIAYPILGHNLGHAYPYSPTFGLPCPTTIFTFGLFLFAKNKVPTGLLIIPLIWSIIGFGAALNFTIYEDTGLLVAGVVGTAIIIIKNYRASKKTVIAG